MHSMYHILLSFVLLCAALMSVNAATFLGCMQDVVGRHAIEKKKFSGPVSIHTHMSVEMCEEICSNKGKPIFGMQFGYECWCGAGSYDTLEKVETSKCTYECFDGQSCGGNKGLVSAYKVESAIANTNSTLDESKRPLISLVMMVKNEAHTLGKTLVNLAQYIDTYIILDTGSTDNTKEVIKETLGPRGIIFEEPFEDYGTTRNRALDLAASVENPAIYTLMLSADETLYFPEELRKFCEKNRDKNNDIDHESYLVKMDVGAKFDSIRLTRTLKNWRYVGRVHEYMAAQNGFTDAKIRVPHFHIEFRATDDERRLEQQNNILKILEEEKNLNPDDARTAFYLARTYDTMGNHKAALDEFRRRIALKGWKEEIYQSKYAIGWQLNALNAPWEQQVAAFMDCARFAPNRAEPFFVLADYHYVDKQFKIALEYIDEALATPYPKQAVLWVEDDVYEWKAHMLKSKICFELKEFDMGMKHLVTAMHKSKENEILDELLNAYEEKLPEFQFRLLKNKYHMQVKRKEWKNMASEEELQNAREIPTIDSSDFSVFLLWLIPTLVMTGVLCRCLFIQCCEGNNRKWRNKEC